MRTVGTWLIQVHIKKEVRNILLANLRNFFIKKKIYNTGKFRQTSSVEISNQQWANRNECIPKKPFSWIISCMYKNGITTWMFFHIWGNIIYLQWDETPRNVNYVSLTVVKMPNHNMSNWCSQATSIGLVMNW